MKTCKIINCWRKQKCHLERDGMEDLCPAIKQLINEAKEQTEKAWREQTRSFNPVIKKEVIDPNGKPGHKFKHTVIMSSNQVVPLTRFRGTRRTIVDSFSIEVALQHMQNYEAARKKKFLKAQAFERKYEVRIIDPGPMPKPWLPQSENNKFYDGATNIEDRSAVITGANPVNSVAKLIKAHRIITRQEQFEKEHWKMDSKLQFNEKLRQEKIMNMLEEV